MDARGCDWLDDERPREKLLSRGGDALSDAELVAIFLRTGVRGKSALEIARGLLVRWQGLGGLLDAPVAALIDEPGLGPAKAAQLKATLVLAERHARECFVRGDALTSPAHCARFLKLRLRRREREIFGVVFLDSQHRVIAYEELFQGTIDGTSVHPREVVRAALRHNAAAVILAHNHPSGVAEPSQADVGITERLRQALALIDVRVLDHLVVGDQQVTSFAERGLL